MYVGENKILSKVNRTDVQFHVMRAIQELSYDVLRSHKAFEQEVPATLVMPLPQDYVNYVSVCYIDGLGVKRPIYPANNLTISPNGSEKIGGVNSSIPGPEMMTTVFGSAIANILNTRCYSMKLHLFVFQPELCCLSF